MRDRSQVPVPAVTRSRTTFGTLAGLLAIGVALAGCLIALLASPASAAGTVSGTVTDVGANPIASIDVFVLDPVWGSTVAQTTTDANGDYSVPVAAGTYRMLFRDPGTSYADRFSGNAPSFATSSTITVPESGSHVEDVTMIELGAVFSGTVTDTGANPVAGAIVEARTFLDAVIATATTDASGNYTLPDVGAGTYRIHVEDPSGTYTNVFHPATQYGAAATNFVVVDGDAVDVD